jgi:hypothetical protein
MDIPRSGEVQKQPIDVRLRSRELHARDWLTILLKRDRSTRNAEAEDDGLVDRGGFRWLRPRCSPSWRALPTPASC